MVDIGPGSGREIDGVMLTRYACLLVARNGNPGKEQVVSRIYQLCTRFESKNTKGWFCLYLRCYALRHNLPKAKTHSEAGCGNRSWRRTKAGETSAVKIEPASPSVDYMLKSDSPKPHDIRLVFGDLQDSVLLPQLVCASEPKESPHRSKMSPNPDLMPSGPKNVYVSLRHITIFELR